MCSEIKRAPRAFFLLYFFPDDLQSCGKRDLPIDRLLDVFDLILGISKGHSKEHLGEAAKLQIIWH